MGYQYTVLGYSLSKNGHDIDMYLLLKLIAKSIIVDGEKMDMNISRDYFNNLVKSGTNRIGIIYYPDITCKEEYFPINEEEEEYSEFLDQVEIIGNGYCKIANSQSSCFMGIVISIVNNDKSIIKDEDMISTISWIKSLKETGRLRNDSKLTMRTNCCS